MWLRNSGAKLQPDAGIVACAMKITQDSIDTAVLGLFRACGIRSCGGRVLYVQLARRWQSTGFRRSDLTAALRRLEASGCLRRETAQPMGTDVILMLDGQRRLASLPLAPGALTQRIRNLVHIFVAAARQRTGKGEVRPGSRESVRKRRAEDAKDADG